MASNSIADLVEVPPHLRGLVIGKKGKMLKKIEADSGVRIEMKDKGAYLKRGTPEQKEQARQMILSVIQAKQHEMPRQKKNITFDKKWCSFLIGPGGATVRRIQDETGTKIQIDSSSGVAHITGSAEENLSHAERMILQIVSQKEATTLSCLKKDVHFPVCSVGMLIGPKGAIIRGIQKDTGTNIRLDENAGVAHITGPTQEHLEDAEQKINNLVLKQDVEKESWRRQHCHKCVKFAVVDGTCVGEDNCFELQEVQSDRPGILNYKLVMKGDQADQEKEMAYVSQLEKVLLEVLREVRKESDNSRNIRTDMWCHFGHVLICNVDEAEARETYELDEINQNLQETDKNSLWKVFFKAGVIKLEYEALEEVLKERPLKVPHNTRFDYTFNSPTKHQIRFKAFVPDSSTEEDGCFTFQDDIVPIKNALVDQSSQYKYRLCAPPSTRLKVDILIPYLTFDCHLVIRTTMRDVKDLTIPEEDKILRDYLDDNLKYQNGEVILPIEKLPSGFCFVYRRQAKRRSYPCSLSNPDNDDLSEFNVLISEEESQEEARDHNGWPVLGKVQTKTDIHVHCDAWDELLDQDDWQPEEIVNKLPAFLRFVKDIQANIKVESTEIQE